jgi:hypothetical protein
MRTKSESPTHTIASHCNQGLRCNNCNAISASDVVDWWGLIASSTQLSAGPRSYGCSRGMDEWSAPNNARTHTRIRHHQSRTEGGQQLRLGCNRSALFDRTISSTLESRLVSICDVHATTISWHAHTRTPTVSSRKTMINRVHAKNPTQNTMHM